MERLDPGFGHLLRNHRIAELNSLHDVVYGVLGDFRLAYQNPAWFRFAEENGGGALVAEWGLGRSLLDCASGVVLEFLRGGLLACLDSGTPWHYDCECSSATVFRQYHQTVHRLGERDGLLMVNSLVVEHPHDPRERPAIEPDEDRYVDANSLVTQCAACRRVKNHRQPGRWDWVPQWVRTPPSGTSHTFCPPCFGAYFPVRDLG